MHKYH